MSVVFVERNAGAIVGVYANLQSGFAEEELASDHEDVMAFLNQPEPVPTITKAQALLYLLSIGKTEADVLAAIATISDPTERSVAEIEWNYRQPFRHDHPLFAALGPAVGITDMETAFRAAAVL